MRITPELKVLELTAEVLGESNTIYPVLAVSKEGLTLIDCGYPGQDKLLLGALRSKGYSVSELRRIVITHHDIDHIGGLPAILASAPEGVEVCAHKLERPHIEGEKPLAKATPEAIAQLDLFPEPHRSSIKRVLEHPPSAPVNRILEHGEELTDEGDLIVLDTPGHTAGHISLYHRPSRTLIAGDALTVTNGKLCGPISNQSLDPALALRSLHVLLPLAIEQVVCYHGGAYRADASSIREAIAAIAAGDAR